MRRPLNHCTLRSLREDDAPSLARQANNRKIWRNLRDAFPHPYYEEDAKEFIGRIKSQPRESVFAIEIDNHAVGAIGLRFREDVESCTAELGYWLGEAYWGRGVATEAIQAIVEFAIDEFRLIRIDAWVFSWNPASARTLEKAGFTLEGMLRRSAIKDGQVIDRWLYAFLPEDGPASSSFTGDKLSR